MPEPPAALVTGASTGIGRACALYLDRKGWKVFAGVRRAEDGERLRARATAPLEAVILDVTSEESIIAAAAAIEASRGDAGLQGLVNNAGIAVASPIEFVAAEDLRHQLEVNVTGQVAVTRALTPALRTGQGRIANMSSISGRMALPLLGPYAASKFALEAISDALRVELAPQGIRVAVIEPGAVRTPIWDKGIARADEVRATLPPEAFEQYGEAIERLEAAARHAAKSGVPPGRVAKAVYHALSSRWPKARYLVGRDARIGALAARFLPDRALDMAKSVRLGLRQQ